jgi:hypothetical protein
MGSVLAIEPSADRAAKLRAVARPHFGDSLTLVDSVNSAFAAMHRAVPELILISPSLPPDKKAELIAGLRALPNATAVQTLTTPDFTTESTTFVNQLKSYMSQSHEQDDDSRLAPKDGRVERRRAFRTAFTRGPQMTVNGTPVVLVDRSATGVQVISAAMLAPGQSVEVAFDYGGKIVKSGAAVVWATLDNPLSEHVRCRAALQFDNPEPFLAVVQQQDEASAPQVPGLIRRTEAHVERARRLERNHLPWLSLKLPEAGEVRLLNLSSSGMLLETSTKFAPGSTTAVQLCGVDQTRVVRARFVRSDILDVGATGVKYVAAATFEDSIDLDGLQPQASPAAITPNPVAEWLKSIAAEIYRGGDPAAMRKQLQDGVAKLLSVGRVEILAGPVPPPDGCDSMYFTILDGMEKAVLCVTFEHAQALSEKDLQMLRAASALGAFLLSRP